MDVQMNSDLAAKIAERIADDANTVRFIRIVDDPLIPYIELKEFARTWYVSYLTKVIENMCKEEIN